MLNTKRCQEKKSNASVSIHVRACSRLEIFIAGSEYHEGSGGPFKPSFGLSGAVAPVFIIELLPEVSFSAPRKKV
jgi:hypothetical protein